MGWGSTVGHGAVVEHPAHRGLAQIETGHIAPASTPPPTRRDDVRMYDGVVT